MVILKGLRGKRGDVDISTLVGWGIAILVLIVGFGIVFYLRSEGISGVEFVKNLFKFGR